MAAKTINWKLSDEEKPLVQEIAKRAAKEGNCDLLNTMMDIAACHANGCPLKLKELLNADEFNFFHDIFGINTNLNRGTGKLSNCFVPRFAL